VLGEYDELTARGIPKTGASNLGGSLVTDGGLVFIGATNDSRFRAFDKDTGAEIWTFRLPATAHATPMTFTGPQNGRQYIVVAAGGGNKYNNNAMSRLMAFAIPREGEQTLMVNAPPRLFARMREGYRGIDEKLPQSVAAQPVPFSHAKHAGPAALKCADCHTGAATGERAGLPAAARCMTCHRTVATESPAVTSLRRLVDSGTNAAWVRIYQLPDFVVFSHARHATVECRSCHGPVEQREVLAKEVSTSMTACLDCHRTRNARTDCGTCHFLGQ
jgi:hypothetical protein